MNAAATSVNHPRGAYVFLLAEEIISHLGKDTRSRTYVLTSSTGQLQPWTGMPTQLPAVARPVLTKYYHPPYEIASHV